MRSTEHRKRLGSRRDYGFHPFQFRTKQLLFHPISESFSRSSGNVSLSCQLFFFVVDLFDNRGSLAVSLGFQRFVSNQSVPFCHSFHFLCKLSVQILEKVVSFRSSNKKVRHRHETSLRPNTLAKNLFSVLRLIGRACTHHYLFFYLIFHFAFFLTLSQPPFDQNNVVC